MRMMSVVSALVIGFLLFILGGLFVQPLMPATDASPVSIFELDYWRGNFAGAILGAIAAYVTHRQSTRYYERRDNEANVSEEDRS